jgi:uncharacterized membrane protein YozB (DUF420 family)
MSFSLNNYLFGPLDTQYCAYFYILSVINFALLVFIVVSLIVYLLSGTKKMDSKVISTAFFGALLYLVLYFQNRLLHTMCVSKEGMTDNKLKNF